jgi:predicted RNA methylase
MEEKDLNNILTWKQSFGLLPIHLIPTQIEDNSFIMLNGGYGNFCLRTETDGRSPGEYHSRAWSSNTKYFVVLDDSNVNIFNWEKERPETITKEQVADNFDKFYKYLVTNDYKSEKDIVPFVIDIFKQFRNLTQEKTNAVEALNLLFVLLAGLEEDVNSIDFDKWGLTSIEIPQNFDSYTDRLKRCFSNINPNLDLIIRHSSGILFQEAQREVFFFNRQIDFWGTLPSKIDSRKIPYSSIHYTPPYLARTIVENAVRQLDNNKPELKIFDPACGSSEFLIEALKQLRENRYKGNVKIIGWDSSQTAINISKFLLQYEKRTIWKDKLDFQIKPVEDSLQEKWSNDYDLILMNPPFVSWEHMEKNSREAVLTVLGSNAIGRPNQASAFFYKSIQSLKDDGIIGCVVPSSLLALDAYKKLRDEAYNLMTINLIGKLGNFVFEDALTDVSFIVGHKPKKYVAPFVLWTRNEKGIVQNALRDLRKRYYSDLPYVDEKEHSIYQPSLFPITKENWKLISFHENELFKTIERFVYEGRLVRIQNIFNVQQGIRTGNNNVFKISKKDYDDLPKKEKIYFRPAVDNESVKNAVILKKNYVWYPYGEDGLIITTEAKLKQMVPYFYRNKLVLFKDSLIKRARRNQSNWWHLSEHRAWLRKKEPRLVSTEFGRSDSFAFDKEGIFAVERGNAWLPKKEFENIDYYYFYLAIFSSPFFDKLLSVYSKQLAGGIWYDLGKKYTKDIPIPNANLTEVRNSEAYPQLIEIGKELSEGGFELRTVLDDILLRYFYPEA